jgi:hypothetical protein
VRNKSKLTLTGVIGAVATTLVLSAGPASADPAAGTYPPLAGTGSDTTQFVLDGLADDIAAIGSYDAIGTPTIRTTANGQQFNRPNGSSAGLRALTASINPNGTSTYPLTQNGATTQVSIAGQLDFARSSSGPSVAGTQLTYIPFGRDAVSYAYSDFGDASVPSALTRDDLNRIYSGAQRTYVDAAGVTRTYVPVLPQASSGTRTFFLQQIGLTEGQVAWITGATVQENNGSQIDAIGELVPFSVASWVAQTNNEVPNTIEDNVVVLGALDDDTLGVVSPVSGGVLNPQFPFARNVYNVVQTSRLTSTAPEDVLLQETFAGSGSDVCEADEVITSFGFGLHDDCGDTTTFRSGYVF